MTYFSSLTAAVLALLVIAPAGAANEVSTSFEFVDSSGEITVGNAPESVVFNNGSAEVVSDPAMANTGNHAWMIAAGETGVINFETPAVSVSFWVRDASETNPTMVTLWNVEGLSAHTFSATTTYEQVSFTAEPGAEIDRITIENFGDTASTGVDDVTAELFEKPFVVIGEGSAGTASLVPRLRGTGDLTVGTQVSILLDNALPLAPATLAVGGYEISMPFKGGVFVPAPDWLISDLTTDDKGGHELKFLVPAGLPSGLQVFFQHWILDPGAAGGMSSSNGLRATLQN